MPSLRTADGRRLAWEAAGSGPPLLCHPGGPGGSSRCFDGLPGLAAERTLLLLDPRGTGSSDPPADPEAYALEDYSADIEAVREHLGLDRLDLLGHSHGGFVAMAWAGAYPDSVGRLVLANTAARFTESIRRVRQAIVESYAGEPWFADALAAQEDHEAGRYADVAEFNALVARRVPFFFPRWDDDSRRVAKRLGEVPWNPDPLTWFNQHIAPTMDLRRGLARVEAPVLVITGGLDPLGEESAREIADALADATVVVVPDAGHFIFGESANAEAWSQAILDFLAGR